PEEMSLIDWTNDHLSAEDGSSTGHYRNPVMLKNRTMLVSHTQEYHLSSSQHTYFFRIKPMLKRYPNDPSSTEHIAGEPLTGAGIIQTVKYWNGNAAPDEYHGPMNEVDVVEVVARQQPKARVSLIEPVEKSVFDEEGVDVNKFRKWLIDNNLALIVSRNTTQRDRADVQQPYNLRVPDGVESRAKPGKMYDISHFQIFQADMLRAYKNYDGNGVQPGRRVFAMPLHNTVEHPLITSANVKNPLGPDGSVKLGLDGSMAAIVPSGRALTWQTTDPNGKGVVRERNWLSFAKGEIRTCSGCHAINKKSQTGDDAPVNKPEALRDLLKLWQKNMNDGGIIPDPPVDPVDVIPDPPVGEVDLKVSKLYQNYPNPFNLTQPTVVRYYLVEDTFVTLKIYNSFGQEIKTLVNENKLKGLHEVIWNGTSSANEIVNGGLYIYKLQTAKKSISRKMSFSRSY
ncbi:MAG: T9SS type A sorting domain-containing protein, partial [Daejeonella sp.]